MSLPSDATIPAATDPDSTLDYKVARMFSEVAGTFDQIEPRTDNDRKLLKFKAIQAIRAYMVYLEGLDIADFLPRETIGKYRFLPDGTFQLFNDDELGYREVMLRGVGDEVHFELGPLDTDL